MCKIIYIYNIYNFNYLTGRFKNYIVNGIDRKSIRTYKFNMFSRIFITYPV